jgi:hypothetical protein
MTNAMNDALGKKPADPAPKLAVKDERAPLAPLELKNPFQKIISKVCMSFTTCLPQKHVTPLTLSCRDVCVM